MKTETPEIKSENLKAEFSRFISTISKIDPNWQYVTVYISDFDLYSDYPCKIFIVTDNLEVSIR